MNHAGESYGTPTGAINGMPVEGGHERLHQHQQQYQYPQQQQQSYPSGAAGGIRNGSHGPMNGTAGLRDQQQAAFANHQPVASTSTPTSIASPSKPAPNKIRKRQKVEYDPVKRFYNDHPGTWDAIQVEEVVSHASSKRQKRTARDLGT